MRRTFFLETYGCQMNVAESFSLERELVNRGWRQSVDEDGADLIILNTCAVRASAEQRIHGRIGHYQHVKESRPLSLVVMGCMTERMKGELREQFSAVNMLVGTFGKRDFIEFLSRAELLASDNPHELERDFFGDEVYEFLQAETSPGGRSAFVPIMHGCNNFCTYCIVPYVRGREVSRPPKEILAEIQRLDREGVREITLIGQNVNSYGTGGTDGIDFPGLLRNIDEALEQVRWIRFISSHPKDFSDSLIDVIAGSNRICRHIHLPVQHGSSAVLKRMNRGYRAQEYLELVGKIRQSLPGVSLSTDLLIGFPGESEEDFAATLELLRTVRFDDAFTYKYNTRSGTEAAGYPDQVPEGIKSERLTQLIDLQRKITEDNRRARLGELVEVLIEGSSRRNKNEYLGRSERNEMVVFPAGSSKPGEFTTVELESLSGITFRAKEV